MRQREIAVTLLADMSTSIMQHLPEGGGRLVDRVRAGVLLFAESMEEVGDAYSIAGFCSKYRDNVSYYTIKDFDEPLHARHPQPDRRHVGAARDAHGRRDPPRDGLLRPRGEPAPAAADPLRRPARGLRRRRRPALPARGHAHGGEGGGREGRAPVLHHGRHDGEPVPAADLRPRALPRARSNQQLPNKLPEIYFRLRR